MSSKHTRIALQFHLRTISVISIRLLVGIVFVMFFDVSRAFCQGSPRSISMWSDVTAEGGEPGQFDDYYPSTPYVVGIGCTETDYSYPSEYYYWVETTVRGPDGSSATVSSWPDPYCSRADVYLQLLGAVGTYNVDSEHYKIAYGGVEAYLGCTHTFVETEGAADHYYYFGSSYLYQGYGRTRKACIMPNCPSNAGKVCYKGAAGLHSTEVNEQCPTGILSVRQKVKRLWFFTVCVEITHYDFYGPFTCP